MVSLGKLKYSILSLRGTLNRPKESVTRNRTLYINIMIYREKISFNILLWLDGHDSTENQRPVTNKIITHKQTQYKDTKRVFPKYFCVASQYFTSV